VEFATTAATEESRRWREAAQAKAWIYGWQPVGPHPVGLPCDPGSVPGLLDEISQLRDKCDVSTDRGIRLELLSKARALVQALETPRETMLKHCGAQVRELWDVCGRVRHTDGGRRHASLLLPSE